MAAGKAKATSINLASYDRENDYPKDLAQKIKQIIGDEMAQAVEEEEE
jgi:hypothetical protein